MMPTNKEFAVAFAIYGGVIGLCAVGAIGTAYSLYSFSQGNNPFSHMPRDKDVSSKYVDLSQLEYIVEDIDRDGEDDLLVSYKGNEYLFVEENGAPMIQEYRLIPSLIVPGEIVVE